MRNKIGFMALAIITVLATLGVGFSMWYSNVTVSGTVQTGNVTLGVSAPTGTWAFKDEGADTYAGDLIWVQGAIGSPNSLPYPPAGADNAIIVSNVGVTVTNMTWATYTGSYSSTLIGEAYSSISGNTVTVTYSNLFPVPIPSGTYESWVADFTVTNNGSIPVKFDVTSPITLVPSTVGNGGNPPAFTVTYGPENNPTASLQGYQLEPTLGINVNIGIQVLEGTAQSYSGSFSFIIQGQQWNEYNSALPPTS